MRSIDKNEVKSVDGGCGVPQHNPWEQPKPEDEKPTPCSLDPRHVFGRDDRPLYFRLVFSPVY